jgi:GxxExxY protein
MELELRAIAVSRQLEVPVEYKVRRLKNTLRLDLLVGERIIVEIKSVERILPVHEAQLLGYLRLTGKRLGLLINFNSDILSKSVRRIAN